MRRRIDNEEFQILSYQIENKNMFQRKKTQKLIKRICLECDLSKNLNHFTSVDEINKDHERIKIYKVCNSCTATKLLEKKRLKFIMLIAEISDRAIDDSGLIRGDE